MGGKVKPPKILKHVDPKYPDAALRAGISGTVSLRIVVGKNGIVNKVEVLKGIVVPPRDDLGLNQSAIDAIKQWRFSPGTKDGEPVSVIATVRINFRGP